MFLLGAMGPSGRAQGATACRSVAADRHRHLCRGHVVRRASASGAVARLGGRLPVASFGPAGRHDMARAGQRWIWRRCLGRVGIGARTCSLPVFGASSLCDNIAGAGFAALRRRPAAWRRLVRGFPGRLPSAGRLLLGTWYWPPGIGRRLLLSAFHCPLTTGRLLLAYSWPPGRLAACCPPPETGRPALGRPSPAAYSWPIATGRRHLAAHSWPPTAYSWQPPAGRPPLAACHWPPTIGRLLLFTCCPPPTTGRLWLACGWPHTGAHPLTAACCWPLATGRLLLLGDMRPVRLAFQAPRVHYRRPCMSPHRFPEAAFALRAKRVRGGDPRGQGCGPGLGMGRAFGATRLPGGSLGVGRCGLLVGRGRSVRPALRFFTVCCGSEPRTSAQRSELARCMSVDRGLQGAASRRRLEAFELPAPLHTARPTGNARSACAGGPRSVVQGGHGRVSAFGRYRLGIVVLPVGPRQLRAPPSAAGARWQSVQALSAESPNEGSQRHPALIGDGSWSSDCVCRRREACAVRRRLWIGHCAAMPARISARTRTRPVRPRRG